MKYCHLTLEERREIYVLRERGLSIRAIARALARNSGTISRELKRNSGMLCYNYLNADRQYQKKLHMKKGGKYQNINLCKYITAGLSKRWSPEQISGRIRLDHSDEAAMRVSFGSIYRWIRKQYISPDANRQLRRHGKLPKFKRSRFPDAKPFNRREPEASSRERIGDWEMDTIVSAKHDLGGVLTMCDRKSRYCILSYMKNKKANCM